MAKQRPVIFRPFQMPRYAFDKLRICRRCGQFTALSEERCTRCGRAALQPVREYAARATGRSMAVRLMLALLLAAAAVYLADNTGQRLLCAAAGLVLCGLLYAAQRRSRRVQNWRALETLLKRSLIPIKEGLEVNRREAVSVLREDDVLAYEKLREVAVLLRGDRVSRQRIALLSGFIIRKDMDLEMEQLLLADFEPLLAKYIGEVAKVRRDLIKDRTFRYVQDHEVEILRMPEGLSILTAVAGAAVRSKRYALLYSGIVARYAELLPRDRFVRLAYLVGAYPYEPWNGLDAKVARVREQKYRYDAEM